MTNDVIAKIKYTMNKNIWKLIISLLIISVISTVMVSFSMMPVVTSLLMGSFSISSMAILLVTSIFISAIQFVLQYGFFVLVFLFYNDQFAVIAHLFAGFRDFKRAFLLGLLFTGIYLSITLSISIVLSILIYTGVLFKEAFRLDLIMFALNVISVVIFAVLYLKLGFTWFFLYENTAITIKEGIKKSLAVTKGKTGKFVAFALKTAGLFLILFVIAYIIKTIPLFVEISFISLEIQIIAVQVLNVVANVCFFLTLLRFSFALVAMYKIYNNSDTVVEEIDNRLSNLPLISHIDSNDNNN